jgi:hypothetical protein
MAHTVGKPVILITQDKSDGSDVPFDLRHLRYTLEGMDAFEEALKLTLQKEIPRTQASYSIRRCLCGLSEKGPASHYGSSDSVGNWASPSSTIEFPSSGGRPACHT